MYHKGLGVKPNNDIAVSYYKQAVGQHHAAAQYNLALDLGFFSNRLTATVDAYYKETKDLLATVPVPAGPQ